MKSIIILILCFLSVSSFAQTEIKLDDVQNHVGDSVKLKAKIYSGKYLESAERTPTFLDVGAKYPNAKLTLVIFGDVRKQFKNAPETFYEGRQEWITGKIELYKNKSQIIIYSPDQIYDIVAPSVGK
jgi:hypothetical protein